MVSEHLKTLYEKLVGKITDGALTMDDIEDYLKLFVDICNQNEDIKEEVEGWNRVLAFQIDGDKFQIRVENGEFSRETNSAVEPNILFSMDEETLLDIFSGEINATTAYMDEKLKVTGLLPDAVKFRALTEIVNSEFNLD